MRMYRRCNLSLPTMWYAWSTCEIGEQRMAPTLQALCLPDEGSSPHHSSLTTNPIITILYCSSTLNTFNDAHGRNIPSFPGCSEVWDVMGILCFLKSTNERWWGRKVAFPAAHPVTQWITNYCTNRRPILIHSVHVYVCEHICLNVCWQFANVCCIIYMTKTE